MHRGHDRRFTMSCMRAGPHKENVESSSVESVGSVASSGGEELLRQLPGRSERRSQYLAYKEKGKHKQGRLHGIRCGVEERLAAIFAVIPVSKTQVEECVTCISSAKSLHMERPARADASFSIARHHDPGDHRRPCNQDRHRLYASDGMTARARCSAIPGREIQIEE